MLATPKPYEAPTSTFGDMMLPDWDLIRNLGTRNLPDAALSRGKKAPIPRFKPSIEI